MAASLRTLCLLRHATPLSAKEEQEDISRALSDTGKQEAERMAHEMKARGIVPSMILCSSAVRAQETMAPFRDVFPEAEARTVPDIYESNNASFLFSLCETVPENVGTLLMIGHVPGVSSLAGALANPENSSPGALKAIALSFAPCSLAVLDIRDPWNALSYDSGTLREFIRPVSEGPS